MTLDDLEAAYRDRQRAAGARLVIVAMQIEEHDMGLFDRWAELVGGEPAIQSLPLQQKTDLLRELERPGELYLKLRQDVAKVKAAVQTKPSPPPA